MDDKALSEYNQRVVSLLEVIAKTETADAKQARELFNLHNERFLPRETGVHCSACRSRVFNKMKEYYNQIMKPNEKI